MTIVDVVDAVVLVVDSVDVDVLVEVDVICEEHEQGHNVAQLNGSERR